MSDTFKRPARKVPEGLLKAIDDPDEFKENKCSKRAKKVTTLKPDLSYDVWFDQHYHIREHLGDDSGARDGIESELVETLVKRSMPYLMAFSSIVPGFSFLNNLKKAGQRASRVVLQESSDCGMRNVVIEVHFVKVDTYEITVKTAMCTDSFIISDGQYAVEFIDNDVVLKKMERKTLKEIYCI